MKRLLAIILAVAVLSVCLFVVACTDNDNADTDYSADTATSSQDAEATDGGTESSTDTENDNAGNENDNVKDPIKLGQGEYGISDNFQ